MVNFEPRADGKHVWGGLPVFYQKMLSDQFRPKEDQAALPLNCLRLILVAAKEMREGLRSREEIQSLAREICQVKEGNPDA